MTASESRYILTLSCPPQVGILARLGQCLADHGAHTRELAHFADADETRFFLRTEITVAGADSERARLEADLAALAGELAMDWSLHGATVRPRLLVLVSQHGHCLNDLLYHHRSGSLPAEVAAVASNHETFRETVEWHGLPFYYLPITPETKAEQEDRIRALIDDHAADFVILARYMQILSEAFTQRYQGRLVNIHHALLPSFKGANPYRRAWERGVKMIGATAHFATADLDEGPIIDQGVARVDHKHSPEDLERVGNDVERSVLTRAVRALATRRVFLHGQRTIVFG